MSETDPLPLYPKMPSRFILLIGRADELIAQKQADEALGAIAKIPLKYQSYPQVLEAKWCALHSAASHDKAFEVAVYLCREYPNIFWGWLFKAESLAYLKRFDEAVNELESARKEFLLPNAELKIAAYRYAQGRREEALKMLSDLISKDQSGHTLRRAMREPLLSDVYRDL